MMSDRTLSAHMQKNESRKQILHPSEKLTQNGYRSKYKTQNYYTSRR